MASRSAPCTRPTRFATLVVMFFYGTIEDKLGLKRTLTILASAVMAGIAPFFIFVYEPLLRNSFGLGVAVGAFVMPMGYMAAAGLLEAFSERLSRTYGFEYGQARAWGSLGHAITALMSPCARPIGTPCDAQCARDGGRAGRCRACGRSSRS